MTRASRISRRAFTLTEILVVIAIIAVLASLTTAAVIAVVGRQKVNNTTNTIKVVNTVLQKHWQYVIDEAKKDAAAGLISQAVINMAGGPAQDPTGERAQVLWIKFRLMEAFPQAYADIGWPATATYPAPGYVPFVYTQDGSGNYYIPPGQQRYIAAYQKVLQQNLKTPPTSPNPPTAINQATESAACLLMALSVNRGSNAALTQDQIGYAVADADGDGVKEFVDAWSPQSPLAPIKFTRFDTTAPNPATSGKTVTFADPVDPDGTLMNGLWYPNSAGCVLFQKQFGYAIETTPGAASYVIPSITSTGGGTPIISYNLR